MMLGIKQRLKSLVDSVILYSLIQTIGSIIRDYINSRGTNIDEVRIENHTKQIEAITQPVFARVDPK